SPSPLSSPASRPTRALHSFPTRRSSDLPQRAAHHLLERRPGDEAAAPLGGQLLARHGEELAVVGKQEAAGEALAPVGLDELRGRAQGPPPPGASPLPPPPPHQAHHAPRDGAGRKPREAVPAGSLPPHPPPLD